MLSSDFMIFVFELTRWMISICISDNLIRNTSIVVVASNQDMKERKDNKSESETSEGYKNRNVPVCPRDKLVQAHIVSL